jgi:hypothetical protein
MNNPPPFVPQTDDERILELLAAYDVAGVEDHKLRQIFNCNDENLAIARATEYYAAAISIAQSEMLARAQDIDRQWDTAEATATKQLVDLMEFNADPRMALMVASRANQATRRAAGNPLAAGQRKASHGPAVIDTNALAGPTRTVRIRTKFAEALADVKGVQRLVEREIEITTTDTGSFDEGMSPSRLKALMTKSLGVDLNEVAITHRSHQSDHGLSGVLDFSQIAMDEFDE